MTGVRPHAARRLRRHRRPVRRHRRPGRRHRARPHDAGLRPGNRRRFLRSAGRHRWPRCGYALPRTATLDARDRRSPRSTASIAYDDFRQRLSSPAFSSAVTRGRAEGRRRRVSGRIPDRGGWPLPRGEDTSGLVLHPLSGAEAALRRVRRIQPNAARSRSAARLLAGVPPELRDAASASRRCSGSARRRRSNPPRASAAGSPRLHPIRCTPPGRRSRARAQRRHRARNAGPGGAVLLPRHRDRNGRTQRFRLPRTWTTSPRGGNPLPAIPTPGTAISGIWRGHVETPEAGFYNFVDRGRLRGDGDTDARRAGHVR